MKNSSTPPILFELIVISFFLIIGVHVVLASPDGWSKLPTEENDGKIKKNIEQLRCKSDIECARQGSCKSATKTIKILSLSG